MERARLAAGNLPMYVWLGVRYGHNNGHLKDSTAQPRAGDHHGESAAKAAGDINSYFNSKAGHKTAKASSSAANKGMNDKSAQSDINGYFTAMAPKVKHVAPQLDPKLDADAATADLTGFFDKMAKGKHGFNNGKLHSKNGHAAPKKVSV